MILGFDFGVPKNLPIVQAQAQEAPAAVGATPGPKRAFNLIQGVNQGSSAGLWLIGGCSLG